MKTQRKLVILSVALAALSVAGLAQAQSTEAPFLGGTSDSSKVRIGKSDVSAGTVHTPGLAGISVQASGIDLQVDFQGLSRYSGTGPVYQLNMPADADHPGNLGVFTFARAGSGDVWFGEWSSTGNVSAGDHTVYYVGDTTGTTLPTSGTASYAVTGLNNSGSGSVLNGTFTANFSTNRLSGSLTRTGSSTVNTLALGSSTLVNYVSINPSTATFSGVARADSTAGTVEGRFYGGNAAALAGIATFADRSKDVAFGGAR